MTKIYLRTPEEKKKEEEEQLRRREELRARLERERETKEVNKKRRKSICKKKDLDLCPCFQDYEVPICDICTPFY